MCFAGVKYPLQYALQCSTELHCLHWGDWEAVLVDPIEGEVYYDSWAAIPLWDNSKWAQPKVGQVLHQPVREYGPELLLEEVCELRPDERCMLLCGLVRSSSCCVVPGPLLPGLARDGYWGPV